MNIVVQTLKDHNFKITKDNDFINISKDYDNIEIFLKYES